MNWFSNKYRNLMIGKEILEFDCLVWCIVSSIMSISLAVVILQFSLGKLFCLEQFYVKSMIRKYILTHSQNSTTELRVLSFLLFWGFMGTKQCTCILQTTFKLPVCLIFSQWSCYVVMSEISITWCIVKWPLQSWTNFLNLHVTRAFS